MQQSRVSVADKFTISDQKHLNCRQTHLHHHTCLFNSPEENIDTLSTETLKQAEFLFAADLLLKSLRAVYLLSSMEQSVSLVKEMTKGARDTDVNYGQIVVRIRLVFSVTFSFFQVCILCLIILLGVLKTDS